jgi:hypothetical protein
MNQQFRKAIHLKSLIVLWDLTHKTQFGVVSQSAALLMDFKYRWKALLRNDPKHLKSSWQSIFLVHVDVGSSQSLLLPVLNGVNRMQNMKQGNSTLSNHPIPNVGEDPDDPFQEYDFPIL